MVLNNVFATTECHLTTRGLLHRHNTFQICLGNKEEAQDNAITKMVHYQICTGLFKYFQECQLCLQEKFEILNYPNPNELLNKRSELISKCPHVNKLLLSTYKSDD